MNFAVIVDVVQKILAEPLPPEKHPILALAKTDAERLRVKELKLKADENAFSKLGTISDAERRLWIRQGYKKPLAAAGLRHYHPCLNTRPVKRIASQAEVESEHARERRLRSQATRGVVALFNAVRQHQSALSSQLENSNLLETQKERILTQMTTSDFLDRLSAGLPKKKKLASDPNSQTITVKPEPDDVPSPSLNRDVHTTKKRAFRTTFGVKSKKKSGAV
ncbi:unnamed protein product [Dicrocoelium dendriticum]|nr:unnamed protein product [Dicrocoelium dendriticum]